MKNVLFVCLGNICCSPLAEAIFLPKIKEKGLENDFRAGSCGTSNYHIGDPPDSRTIRNTSKSGIEIQHVCRQLSEGDVPDPYSGSERDFQEVFEIPDRSIEGLIAHLQMH